MQEIELKLVIPAAQSERAVAVLTQLLGPVCETQDLVSIYYDTPERQLRSQRMALRLRKQGVQWIQTLKGGGGVHGGLHSRNEWNWPVESKQLDASCLAEAGWPAELSIQTLQPVFTTAFERGIWWSRQPGVEIEVAFDRGRVYNEEHDVPLNEIELELKVGEPADLFALAGQIAGQLPCWPGFVSKAQKGYGLGLPVTRNDAPPRDLNEALRRVSIYLDSVNAAVTPSDNWSEYLLNLTWLRVFLGQRDLSLDQVLVAEMRRILSSLQAQGVDALGEALLNSTTIGQICLKLARV
ncbi:MAG: CYTH domain-containing protein [Hahellaceae bacterium]|jgi:inorganic triphosphatase YgiF|nr:CYTH domain-containing protein [Hahellaceae bacterium]